MNLSLTRKQFTILACAQRCTHVLTQREVSQLTGISLGSVNRALNVLTEHGLLSGTHPSPAGMEALEPYRARRAVILAAGFGSRLMPVTLNTPKPLIRIRGTRIIDTLLDALLAADIREIYIVRGYLGEQFDQLLSKYPMIRFLDNPLYNQSGNISSALYARHLLQNAYVLEGDLYLRSPGLITRYQYASNYLGAPVESTDDWCFTTRGQTITGIAVGGTHCHHMFGLSYWNARDGARLAQDIEDVWNMPGGRERFWDQVPLQYCQKHYQVETRDCSLQDLQEVNCLRDLQQLDPAYG